MKKKLNLIFVFALLSLIFFNFVGCEKFKFDNLTANRHLKEGNRLYEISIVMSHNVIYNSGQYRNAFLFVDNELRLIGLPYRANDKAYIKHGDNYYHIIGEMDIPKGTLNSYIEGLEHWLEYQP